MSVDQNGWQDVSEEEREALAEWEETQGGHQAGTVVPTRALPGRVVRRVRAIVTCAALDNNAEAVTLLRKASALKPRARLHGWRGVRR